MSDLTEDKRLARCGLIFGSAGVALVLVPLVAIGSIWLIGWALWNFPG